MKRVIPHFLLLSICFCFGDCTSSELFEPMPEESFSEQLSILSESYDIPVLNELSPSERTQERLNQIETCMRSLHCMINGELDACQLSLNTVKIVPRVSSLPTLLSQSETLGVAVGDASWICCFYISWANGIDVSYSAESGWETFGDDIVSAYINPITNRVNLDASFYLSLGGITTVGRYALVGYYDLNNSTSHFKLTRIR